MIWRNLSDSEDFLGQMWRALLPGKALARKLVEQSPCFCLHQWAEQRVRPCECPQPMGHPAARTASCGCTRAQTLGSLPWLSGCGQSTFWLKGGGGKFIHSRCKPCPAVPWCNLQISFSWLYSLSPWFHIPADLWNSWPDYALSVFLLCASTEKQLSKDHAINPRTWWQNCH